MCYTTDLASAKLEIEPVTLADVVGDRALYSKVLWLLSPETF